MPQNVPKNDRRREPAALALACGRSATDTARACGVNRKTVFRWLQDDAFQARIRELRGEMFQRAVGRLSEVSGKAAGTLAALLDSQNEMVRLAAARLVLSIGQNLHEIEDLARRIEDLEAGAKKP